MILVEFSDLTLEFVIATKLDLHVKFGPLALGEVP